MVDREIDYSEYSLSELREARGSINERKYRERSETLDLLIRDREAVEARKSKPQRVSIANEDGDIASVKPGRGVSLGRGLSEIVGSILFAGFWISLLPPETGIFGYLVGWFVGISGVIGGLYHLYNAFAEDRFSEQDIVEPGKEPDPFAAMIGKETERGGDT